MFVQHNGLRRKYGPVVIAKNQLIGNVYYYYSYFGLISVRFVYKKNYFNYRVLHFLLIICSKLIAVAKCSEEIRKINIFLQKFRNACVAWNRNPQTTIEAQRNRSTPSAGYLSLYIHFNQFHVLRTYHYIYFIQLYFYFSE